MYFAGGYIFYMVLSEYLQASVMSRDSLLSIYTDLTMARKHGQSPFFLTTCQPVEYGTKSYNRTANK